MKKRKTKLTALTLLLSLLTTMLQPLCITETYQGATNYTNAKEFYESTASNGQHYHAEMVNGTIYYATSAKLASSSSNLRYHTVGFDIELSGNGHSLSFTVQRTGGSMTQIGQPVRSNGYEYLLYAVDDNTLFHLASNTNPTEASYILDASVISVRMNAILVTKQGNNLSGGITENGSGGFTKWGTIYRLKDSTNLSSLKRIFTGHDFKSYINIESDLNNHQLQIRYQVQGLNSTSSTTATVGNGFTINDGFLYQNGSTYIQKQRILQQTTLLSQSSIGLQKTGYHLINGREWVTNDNRYFSTSVSYMPKVLDPIVGERNHGITMYANWQPNNYSVSYNANGGLGTVAPSTFTYDQTGYLRANTYSKTGFYLEQGAEWNTKPDGTGTSYGSYEEVKNLTANNGENITLYANWKACVVSITTDKQGGSGGTDVFYQKYSHGYYKEYDSINQLTSIAIPNRTGYHFQGYYGTVYPIGLRLVNENGIISVPNTYFLKNSIIYADYEPKIYNLTFDKQGGIGGTDQVNPIYDEILPFAEAPAKNGSSFKGYFTKPNGQGTMYYNEFMASDTIYKTDGDITLYAYWLDETPPDVYLTSNINEWTNRQIVINVSAIDYGSGLSSVLLYQDGILVVDDYTNLKGVMQKTFTFNNNKEGVILYKVVATDMSGNTVEIKKPVYYDITEPKSMITYSYENENIVSFTVDVTDINVQ